MFIYIEWQSQGVNERLEKSGEKKKRNKMKCSDHFLLNSRLDAFFSVLAAFSRIKLYRRIEDKMSSLFTEFSQSDNREYVVIHSVFHLLYFISFYFDYTIHNTHVLMDIANASWNFQYKETFIGSAVCESQKSANKGKFQSQINTFTYGWKTKRSSTYTQTDREREKKNIRKQV